MPRLTIIRMVGKNGYFVQFKNQNPGICGANVTIYISVLYCVIGQRGLSLSWLVGGWGQGTVEATY